MQWRSFPWLFVTAFLAVTRPVVADPLPVNLQSDLLAKVAGYDKNLRARAGDVVRTVIVTKAGDEEASWAQSLRSGLAAKDRIAGLPHSESIVVANKVDAVATQCKAERVAIVVISASFLDDSASIANAFDGANILTVTPDQELTRRSVVLGFELVSGKPKLFLNQALATKQNVAMSAEVMKLMTVYQ